MGKYYVEELACWPRYYPNTKVLVYGVNYYLRGNCSDEYTWQITVAKQKDNFDYFKPFLKKSIDQLCSLGKIVNIKIVTIMPSSNLKFNSTLISAGEWLSSYLSCKFILLLERTKEGRRNVGSDNIQKRFEKTSGSLNTKYRNIEEKNILLLDDIRATGFSILESVKILNKAGFNNVIPIVFGISKNLKKGY